MKEYPSNRVPIESILLTVVATAGIIATVAVMPGIAPLLKLLGRSSKRPYPKSSVTDALSRLKNKGLIRIDRSGGRKIIHLTEKGKERLKQYQGKSAVLKIPQKWDGKWRLVMFDIIEPLKALRASVRRELSQAGFVRLQDSVWVYPYDCEEYVALLKADKRIGKSLLYIVAEKVEYDRPLKGLFSLK